MRTNERNTPQVLYSLHSLRMEWWMDVVAAGLFLQWPGYFPNRVQYFTIRSAALVRSNRNVHPAVSPSKVCWSTTSRLWTSTSSPKEVSWGEVLLGKSLLELTLLERACKNVDLWDRTGRRLDTQKKGTKQTKKKPTHFLPELHSTACTICCTRCGTFKSR